MHVYSCMKTLIPWALREVKKELVKLIKKKNPVQKSHPPLGL